MCLIILLCLYILFSGTFASTAPVLRRFTFYEEFGVGDGVLYGRNQGIIGKGRVALFRQGVDTLFIIRKGICLQKKRFCIRVIRTFS